MYWCIGIWITIWTYYRASAWTINIRYFITYIFFSLNNLYLISFCVIIMFISCLYWIMLVSCMKLTYLRMYKQLINFEQMMVACFLTGESKVDCWYLYEWLSLSVISDVRLINEFGKLSLISSLPLLANQIGRN